MDFAQLKEVEVRVEKMLEDGMAAIDANMTGNVPGTRQARGAENVLAVRHIIDTIAPPELWIRPDGTEVLMSPWMADLESGLVVGGREELNRINRAIAKMREEAGLG